MDINEFNEQFKNLYTKEKEKTEDIVTSTEKNDKVDVATIMNSRLRKIDINPGWLSLPIMKKSSDLKHPQWFSLMSLNLNDENEIVSASLKDLESGEKIVVPLEDFQKLIDYNEEQLENNADLYYSVGDQYGLRRGTKRETNVEVVTEHRIEELLKSYQDEYVDDRIKDITKKEAVQKFKRTNKPLSEGQLLYIYIKVVNKLKPTDDFVEYFQSHKEKLPLFMRDAIKYMFRIAYNNPDAQLVIKHHGNNLEFQYQDNKKAIRNFEKAPTSENL